MKHYFMWCISMLAVVAGTHAQTVAVSSIEVQPATPAANDFIIASVTTEFPGGPCSRESYLKTIQNDTIILNAFYCYQSGSGGCTSTDTFAIGQLPPGNYVIRAMLNTSNAPAVCGSATYLLRDIGLASFTVTTATGVPDAVNSGDMLLSPNPAGDVIFVKVNRNVPFVTLRIFDLQGKMVYTDTFTSAQGNLKITLSHLPEGLYSYSLHTAGVLSAGRLVIAR
ncbi:MAG: hypothetical protein KatS3mg031_0711 [Chitinophagales bacterium]|nr:MAG: hypothetical protein KatS3mg031_0711 [Chitinophagales bacterium]